MKLFPGLLLACCLLAPLAAQQSDSTVNNFNEFFTAAKMYRPFNLGFGNFTYGQSKFSSSFSLWVQDQLKVALTRNTNWRLVNTALFDNIDPKYRESWGSLANASNIEAIVAGHYQELEGSAKGARPDIVLTLELTDMTTGTLKGRRDFLIGAAEIPASIQIQPPDLGAALALNQDLQAKPAPAAGVTTKSLQLPDEPNGFTIKASTNRGESGVFRDGEALRVSFFATSDAYVKVYHIDVNGTAQLIFPNRFHTNNLVKALKTVSIPGPEYGEFAFLLHAPFGTEFIKIVASTKQFSDIEGDFQPLGQAGQVFDRDKANRAPREAQIREVVLNYTIVQ